MRIAVWGVGRRSSATQNHVNTAPVAIAVAR